MPLYRGGLIGLTGIGANPAPADPSRPLAGPMPVSHAGAYALLPNIELVGVCDLRLEALDRFRAVWGAEWPELRYCTDYRELLGLGLDFLSVCTSDHAHAQIVVDGCAAGLKGIFCEKPIATTTADADRMVAAAAAAGIPLQIDHTRRWWPVYQLARDRLRAGEIGELKAIQASRCHPRAMLFRNGTHLIDSVVFFADSDPDWVFADLEDGFEDYVEYGGDGGRDPSREPGVQGYIRFRNGVRAFVNSHKQAMSPYTIELLGTGGRITVVDPAGLEVFAEGRTTVHPVPTWTRTGISAALDELIRCAEGTRPELTSPGSEACRTLRIILGFLRSQAEGNRRVAV